MPGYPRVIVVFCLIAWQNSLCHAADAPEIVRRATAVMRADWAAAPDYSFIQRDDLLKNGKRTGRTYRVVMIAGSDYYMPVAIDDRPLPPDRQKEREQNGALSLEFPEAFSFALVGEESLSGQEALSFPRRPGRGMAP